MFVFFFFKLFSSLREGLLLALRGQNVLKASRVLVCEGLQRIDLQTWGRLQENVEGHRNVGSQEYVQTHLHVCLSFP